MKKFVASRNAQTASPQNGQPAVNSGRLAAAANARVPMKSNVARPATAYGLHGRGESIAHRHPSPLQQQHLQHRQSSEGGKRDQYDTDAESLDTTINHSIVQVEDTQRFDQEPPQPDDEELESGDDEEASDEAAVEFVEIPEHVQQFIVDAGHADDSHDEQVQFLRETQPQLFRTVDGDSYPTTTEGNPTEVDEQQEQPYENPGTPSPSPSPTRFPAQGQMASMFEQQSHQGNIVIGAPHAPSATQQTTKLYQQGAQLRGQQRLESAAHVRGQSSQQHVTFETPTSQAPTYNQTNPAAALAVPLTTHSWPGVVHQVAQNGAQRPSRKPPVPEHTQNPISSNTEATITSKRIPATRAKIVPRIHEPIEPASLEEYPEHMGDYDPEALFSMKYEELRDEKFDKNPREQEPVLPKDIREKPLSERLQFARQELEPADQAKFFTDLPTAEWEDAGDWFLQQFGTIITKTTEARQKKRKQAQAIEKAIEDRHKHIAKKQRLIECAMTKMQAQGEGLVPRSPRASKSPHPRTG